MPKTGEKKKKMKKLSKLHKMVCENVWQVKKRSFPDSDEYKAHLDFLKEKFSDDLAHVFIRYSIFISNWFFL